MPDYQPISASRHAGKYWRPAADYGFARGQAVVVVGAAEMARAVLSLPIAFQRRNDRVLPVAVLGLNPECNLMVAENGKWLGGYLPAALRAYPFMLRSMEDGKQVLCIDESADCLVSDPDGRPLFGDEGKPSTALEEVLRFLSLAKKSRQLADQASASLLRHGLLKPWTIRVATRDGEKALDGLLQIDEAALGTLNGDALVDLRDAGALALAYCQLISIQHIALLAPLYDAQATKVPAPADSGHSLLDSLSQGGTLNLQGF